MEGRQLEEIIRVQDTRKKASSMTDGREQEEVRREKRMETSSSYSYLLFLEGVGGGGQGLSMQL